MVRKKLLAALLAIMILAAAWYCVTRLYHANRSRAGTMVQVENQIRIESQEATLAQGRNQTEGRNQEQKQAQGRNQAQEQEL